jgi:F-type H+-transporting ATPase subunit gamma
MKALAASSIGQYEKAVKSLNDYNRTVELGLAACLRQADPGTVGVAKTSTAADPIGAVVFGSDQGLVGRFNEVVVDFAVDKLNKLPAPKKRIWAVGERAHGLLADAGFVPPDKLSVPTSVHAITPLVGEILIEIEAARERHEVVEVYVFHNCPKGGAVYDPVSRRLLPLDQEWQSAMVKLAWPTKTLPQIVEGPSSTLSSFIRGYLFFLLFQACAESLNSENASRLAAMQRSEKNIKDMLEDLNRKFNHVRQESIDEDLFDVVSGFESLTKRRSHVVNEL